MCRRGRRHAAGGLRTSRTPSWRIPDVQRRLRRARARELFIAAGWPGGGFVGVVLDRLTMSSTSLPTDRRPRLGSDLAGRRLLQLRELRRAASRILRRVVALSSVGYPASTCSGPASGAAPCRTPPCCPSPWHSRARRQRGDRQHGDSGATVDASGQYHPPWRRARHPRPRWSAGGRRAAGDLGHRPREVVDPAGCGPRRRNEQDGAPATGRPSDGPRGRGHRWRAADDSGRRRVGHAVGLEGTVGLVVDDDEPARASRRAGR